MFRFKAIPSVISCSNIINDEQEQLNEVVLEHRRHELYQSCEKDCAMCEKKDDQIEFLKLNISALTAQLEEAKNLKAANHNLKQHLDSVVQENTALKKQNVKLEKMETIKKESIQSSDVVPIMKKMLGDTLTSNQIDLIIKHKKRVRWTKEEISKAFTLKYFSSRAYCYVGKDFKVPMAAPSTLQRYGRKINLKQVILEDVLNLVRTAAKPFSNKDRECFLSFDKMKVESVLEYNPAADEVMGPFNYVQVVMARGLFKNCKQPIYIGFDQSMTKEIIMEIIDLIIT